MKQWGPAILLALAAALAVVPDVAQAQGSPAVTAQVVHLRAGPAPDYPVVAILPAGYEVLVQGCVSDYTWCDVIAGLNRGWIYAGNLNYLYLNSYVPLLDYGSVAGIAIFGFVLGDYWGHYYYDRPWYRDRDYWIHHRPPPRYGPPPGGVARPIPHGGPPSGSVARPVPHGNPPPGTVPRPPMPNAGAGTRTAPAPRTGPAPGGAPPVVAPHPPRTNPQYAPGQYAPQQHAPQQHGPQSQAPRSATPAQPVPRAHPQVRENAPRGAGVNNSDSLMGRGGR